MIILCLSSSLFISNVIYVTIIKWAFRWHTKKIYIAQNLSRFHSSICTSHTENFLLEPLQHFQLDVRTSPHFYQSGKTTRARTHARAHAHTHTSVVFTNSSLLSCMLGIVLRRVRSSPTADNLGSSSWRPLTRCGDSALSIKAASVLSLTQTSHCILISSTNIKIHKICKNTELQQC